VRIAEIFHSIQGEGQFAGTESVFLRTTGCNLRCWFCDTPYTSWRPEGTQRPWEAVADEVLAIDCEHVVITGGEPLLQPEIVPLTQKLRAAERFITIETAGTVVREVEADLMSISPKRANSTPAAAEHPSWSARHEALRTNVSAVRRLMRMADYQLKFVIDRPEDLDDVEAYLAPLPPAARERVWLMPQGITEDALRSRWEWLEPAAAERGFHITRRLHIELFGNVRGR
jgi:7-carboxy-7-deazaguanine synthase